MFVTLALTAWSVPDDLKPNDEEVNAFTVPLTNILLRHIPITGKMSQDTLDLIAILGAGGLYYRRTSKTWTAYNAQRAKEKQAEQIEDLPTMQPGPTLDRIQEQTTPQPLPVYDDGMPIPKAIQ